MQREGSFRRRKRRLKLEELKLEAKVEGRTTVQIQEDFSKHVQEENFNSRLYQERRMQKRNRQTERKPISKKRDPTWLKSSQVSEDARTGGGGGGVQRQNFTSLAEGLKVPKLILV